MAQHEQPVVDREPLPAGGIRAGRGVSPGALERDAEGAARRTLRAQIAKLEAELSQIVAQRFPFIAAGSAGAPVSGPRLPDLEELERTRDRLAARLSELNSLSALRREHERAARDLLERMKLEPGRYRYYRVPVRDLGQGGCGVWEVRPRLGIIGMLAGWWELTLSSGCPLGMGSCSRHDPAERRLSIAARLPRWRSVIEPTVFFSDIGTCARNLRQRVWPQRRWLISRSATAMLSASHGQSRMTSATVISPDRPPFA